MILFTPIISTIFLTLFLSLSFLGIRKSLTKELSECASMASSIQIEHRKLTNRLLALNTPAKALRVSRKSAEVAHKLALPQLKPVTFAALQVVKMSQKFLRIKQQALIFKGRSLSIQSNLKFIKKGFVPLKPSKGLEVVKVHKKSDSPDYKLKPNYENRKKIRYFKLFSMYKYLPSSLINFLNIKSKSKKFFCGSTVLVKGEAPWKTKLILGKF